MYETQIMLHNRIKPIDGLRTFAAFGVLWIHICSFYANPPLKLFSIDLYQVVAILGNGVDFFFVISGFCMYLMTRKKKFNTTSYLQFLYKRFLRIAPAFYAAVLVYACIIKFYDHSFSFGYNVFYHLLFLNNIVTGNTISGPFWSIGTEWHFYLLLPLFIYLSNKISIVKTVLLFSAGSLILFSVVNLGYLDYGWWETQILIRFPEFAIGIISAWYFTNDHQLPKLFKGVKGILLSLFIMYLGRLMRYTPVLEEAGSMHFLLRTIADTVMTIGFGLLLFHVITETSRLSRLLSGTFITYLGRISFSIYLWHSLSILMLASFLKKLPFGNLNPVAGFILVSLLTIFISHFSYKYLEAFYFKMKPKEEKPIQGILEIQPSAV